MKKEQFEDIVQHAAIYAMEDGIGTGYVSAHHHIWQCLMQKAHIQENRAYGNYCFYSRELMQAFKDIECTYDLINPIFYFACICKQINEFYKEYQRIRAIRAEINLLRPDSHFIKWAEVTAKVVTDESQRFYFFKREIERKLIVDFNLRFIPFSSRTDSPRSGIFKFGHFMTKKIADEWLPSPKSMGIVKYLGI